MSWTMGAWIQGRKSRYRLTSKVPSGGAYGEIWSVVDEAGQPWIVKRALSRGRVDLRSEIEFHEREAAATGTALSAPIHDHGSDDQDPFFVRRPYDGDLGAWLRGGPPVGERLAVLAQLCRDVRRWHERGRHHRDLKPENVLYQRWVDHVRPVLMDTALYRGLGRDAAQTGRGTLGYMAWEAGLRGRPVTAAVDTFALGVMCYEILAEGGGRPELASRHQQALSREGQRAQQLSHAGRLDAAREAELAALVELPDPALVDLATLGGFTEADARRLRAGLEGTVSDAGAELLLDAVEGCLLGDPLARMEALPTLVEALEGAQRGSLSWVMEPPSLEPAVTICVPSGLSAVARAAAPEHAAPPAPPSPAPDPRPETWPDPGSGPPPELAAPTVRPALPPPSRGSGVGPDERGVGAEPPGAGGGRSPAGSWRLALLLLLLASALGLAGLAAAWWWMGRLEPASALPPPVAPTGAPARRSY